jgi:hypothetical protein
MASGSYPIVPIAAFADIDASCHALRNLDPSLRKRPVPVTQLRRIPTASQVIGSFPGSGWSCRNVEFKPDVFPRPRGPDDAIFQ